MKIMHFTSSIDCLHKELRMIKAMNGMSDISANMWAMRDLKKNGLVVDRISGGERFWYLTNDGEKYLLEITK